MDCTNDCAATTSANLAEICRPTDAEEAFFDESDTELFYMVQGGMLTIEFA